MRVAILHSSISGFFPRFYAALHASIVEQGNECRLFVPQSKTNRRVAAEDKYIFGFRSNTFIHQKLYALTGLQDIFSIFSTIALIHALKKYKADVLHCHLFNGKYICLPLLLSYAAKEKLPIVGTMHDCSAFTGRCAYYDEINCRSQSFGLSQIIGVQYPNDLKLNTLFAPVWSPSLCFFVANIHLFHNMATFCRFLMASSRQECQWRFISPLIPWASSGVCQSRLLWGRSPL